MKQKCTHTTQTIILCTNVQPTQSWQKCSYIQLHLTVVSDNYRHNSIRSADLFFVTHVEIMHCELQC